MRVPGWAPFAAIGTAGAGLVAYGMLRAPTEPGAGSSAPSSPGSVLTPGLALGLRLPRPSMQLRIVAALALSRKRRDQRPSPAQATDLLWMAGDGHNTGARGLADSLAFWLANGDKAPGAVENAAVMSFVSAALGDGVWKPSASSEGKYAHYETDVAIAKALVHAAVIYATKPEVNPIARDSQLYIEDDDNRTTRWPAMIGWGRWLLRSALRWTGKPRCGEPPLKAGGHMTVSCDRQVEWSQIIGGALLRWGSRWFHFHTLFEVGLLSVQKRPPPTDAKTVTVWTGGADEIWRDLGAELAPALREACWLKALPYEFSRHRDDGRRARAWAALQRLT